MLLKKGLLSSCSGGGGTSYNVETVQIPIGDKNGSNKSFSVSPAPLANTSIFFVNGQGLTEGIDFTLSGSTYTLLGEAPTSVTNLLVLYNYRSLTPATSTPKVEIPIGVKNGINTVFEISQSPLPDTLLVLKNGQTLTEGIDYTLSGVSITFLIAPIEADNLLTKFNY